ncbi:HtaA domain-containing protein [Corynebacterium kutscheri]|uniref:HtaA domain-containing protein n=1 Tax=Corynebacterium kutscheri TaxID=35755 RepID=UPI0037C14E32
MKNRIIPSFVVALSMVGATFTVPQLASAQEVVAESATCQRPGLEITGGTLKWGIKQSFRQYIKGPIAKGDWTTSGDVKNNGKDATAQDFQFQFTVDPEKSFIELDKNGKVIKSEIATKDSTLEFKGHHGSLYTNMSSPYFTTQDSAVKAGSSYLGYYVPGKAMTDYTKDDQIEANKKTGRDTFAEGSAKWDLDNGHKSLKFTGSQMMYVPKPGTQYDSTTKKQTIEGIDVIFMGIYNKNYKPEIDEVNAEFMVKDTCLDGKKDPDHRDQDSSKDGNSSANQGSITMPKIGSFWNIALAIVSAIGLVAILGKTVIDAAASMGIKLPFKF